MAYPNDEENGANGFLKTSLADPTIGRTATSDNGDVVNYAPPRPPIGALPSREAQIQALLPTLPDSLKNFMTPPETSNSTFVSDSAARQRDADFARYGTGLPDEVQKSYGDHRAALAEADKYLAVAGHFHNMRNEIESKLDSADFLKGLSSLDHTDPNFESSTAKLLAQYPKAGGQAVTDALSSMHSARANYLQGVAPGGANEFTKGSPEQQTYINTIHQTKDPRAARAAALNTQKGEEMVKVAAAKGLIDPNELFAWDAQKQDYVHPEVFNPDGSVNYHQIGLLAATAEGSGESRKAQLDVSKNAVAAAEKFLTIHKEEPDPSDPLFKEWHAANSIIIRSMRAPDAGERPSTMPGNAPAQPAATPAPTPAPVKAASDYTRF